MRTMLIVLPAMAITVAATYLAFDDTDSPDGMCTTYLAALVLQELREYDLMGLPRLVRLNPNIPWKTRGNAAICLPLGIGSGRARPCGSLGREEVKYYPWGRPADPEEVVDRASGVLEKVARFDCDQTNPGVVAVNGKLPPSLYWEAVRGIVPIKRVEFMLKSRGASWRKYKKGRGIIGASAAISWRPRDRTWEVIAYRSPARFGTPRKIDPASVREMDQSTRATFNNYDYENDHMAICPGSPCPILFGIRGDSEKELLRARLMIRGEAADKWLLFLTNQATEDHLTSRKISGLKPMMSARVRAKVVDRPKTVVGGHVIVRVRDDDEIDAAFYEPSRGFREVARKLLPGDEVVLCGSVRAAPRSLNVEKMKVVSMVDDLRKVRNPLCSDCGKRMGSMGKGQGYRCKKCGAKTGAENAEWRKATRDLGPGWYEPPVASRRHLHKPLRRMSRGDIDKL